MKTLGIDYGTKNIGLAISDDEGKIAFGHKVLNVKDSEDALDQIKNEVKENDVDQIVIGIPLGIDEKPTKISLEVDSFIDLLTKKFDVNIVKWNETMTSRMAIETSRELGYKKIDKDIEAARIILQEFLEYTT